MFCYKILSLSLIVLKVCIGEGIWLPEEKWRWISKASKDSIFCKELAVAVWGSEVLKDRSTEGKICNRFKQMGAVAKPPLTPARYQAVKSKYLANYRHF